MLSTPGPMISTSPHQPVPGGGARRDHNAGKVRHDRSARRARARPLLASASPCAPRDAGRNDVRRSPRLRARKNLHHAEDPRSGLEPPDVALRSAWQLQPLTCAGARTSHRVSNTGAHNVPPRYVLCWHAPGRQRVEHTGALRSASHAREEKRGRSAATRNAVERSAPPADQADWPHPRCVTLRPRPPPASEVAHACAPPWPLPTRSDPLGA